jgi:hypothetical protein
MRPDVASTIRARLIAAMERRAAGLDGQARRALEARLDELRALPGAADEAEDTDAAQTHPNPLRELVDRLTWEISPGRAAYPEVPAIEDFRELWSTLRSDSQLRQSLAHTAADAGPLNSIALAGRAIALLRERSPGYLRSFLAYVDELAWLEQLQGATSRSGARQRQARPP